MIARARIYFHPPCTQPPFAVTSQQPPRKERIKPTNYATVLEYTTDNDNDNDKGNDNSREGETKSSSSLPSSSFIVRRSSFVVVRRLSFVVLSSSFAETAL